MPFEQNDEVIEEFGDLLDEWFDRENVADALWDRAHIQMEMLHSLGVRAADFEIARQHAAGTSPYVIWRAICLRLFENESIRRYISALGPEAFSDPDRT